MTRRVPRTSASPSGRLLRGPNDEKITATPLLTALLSLLALVAGLLPGGGHEASAQPVNFGSADDPREPGRRAPWEAERHVGLWTGPSLVGPQWRGQLTAVAAYTGPNYAGRLKGTFHGGLYGSYEDDTDETYDLVRLLDFVRYVRSDETLSLYGRAGPIQHMTLGPAGHLVNFFRSNIAYDERTVGLEAFAQTPRFSLGLFTDDVRLKGATGGRFATRPFAGTSFAATRPALASAEIGLTAVTDLGLRSEIYADSLQPPTAFALDARYDVLDRGGVSLSPFASAATLLHYGWGLGAGAAVSSENFADLARFALRLGLFYSSNQFTPGAFGPFYTINNLRARLSAEAAAAEDAPGERSVATPLADVASSPGWRLGLRLLFFERFELTSSYYGHLGDQDLSRYHLRLFYRTPAGTRLYVRLDRAGLDHVFSVFSAADDQTAVTFNADYRLPFNLGPAGVWAHLRTRYTFEQWSANRASNMRRFIPQRRFEPSIGVRMQL